MRITNNKLSYDIINRIMLPSLTVQDDAGNKINISNVTSIELDLLLYLSLRQDQFGNIKGIYYKDAMLDLFCCKASFYNALYALEKKEYIVINYANRGYWDCTILNNIYRSANDDKKGYFNTNREFLFDKRFKQLKINEKKLCIKLSILYNTKKGVRNGINVYLSTIKNWLGVGSTTLAYDYLDSISFIFPCTYKVRQADILVSVTSGNSFYDKSTNKTERENYLTHKLKYFFNSFKISYTLKDIKDIIILLGQYSSIPAKTLYTSIFDVILKDRIVKPKLINFILSPLVSTQ